MKIPLYLLFAVAANCACAQTLAPELAPIATKYKADVAMLEAQRLAAIAQSQNAYTATLGTAERSATTAGKVDLLAAIANERASVTGGLMPPAFPPGLPKELQVPRKTYLDALARIRAADAPRRQAIDAAYLRALATLDAKGAKNPELAKQLESERKAVIASTQAGAGGSKSNAKSAVVNGTFDLADEDGRAKAWVKKDGDAFRVAREGTNGVLHASAKVPGYSQVCQDILLPPKARSVTLSGRIRGKLTARTPDKPGFGAKILAVFLDAQEQGTSNWVPFDGSGGTDVEWKTVKAAGKIPDGMKGIRVLLELNNVAGEFDFDDIEVEFR
jgi:hypothetical protein